MRAGVAASLCDSPYRPTYLPTYHRTVVLLCARQPTLRYTPLVIATCRQNRLLSPTRRWGRDSLSIRSEKLLYNGAWLSCVDYSFCYLVSDDLFTGHVRHYNLLLLLRAKVSGCVVRGSRSGLLDRSVYVIARTATAYALVGNGATASNVNIWDKLVQKRDASKRIYTPALCRSLYVPYTKPCFI